MTDTAIAYISGSTAQACVAGLRDTYVLCVGAEPRRCDTATVSNLLTLAPDVEVMDAGIFPFPDVSARLSRVWSEWRILDLILSSADSILPVALRRQVISMADELIRQQPEAADWARERFFIAVPLDSMQVVIARELARGVEAMAIATELSCLYYTGTILSRLKNKWVDAVVAAGLGDRNDTIWLVSPIALALRDDHIQFARFSEQVNTAAADIDQRLVEIARVWLNSMQFSWDLFKRCTRVSLNRAAVLRISRRNDRLVAWYGVSSLSKVVDLSAVKWTWSVRPAIARPDGTFELGDEEAAAPSPETWFGHDVVPVQLEGAIQPCLGVTSGSVRAVYLFVDRGGSPLIVSPREASAFLCIDDSLATEGDTDDLPALVNHVNWLLKKADPVVRSEAASRLYRYVLRAARYLRDRDLAVRLRAQVTSMFSWRWIDFRLGAILKRIDPGSPHRVAEDGDFADERPVPVSRHLFATLRSISARGEVPNEWTPDAASLLVNEIWSMHPETFPGHTRSLLIRILHQVSQQFKVTSDVRNSHLDGAEVARTAIIGHLAISRLKEVDRPPLAISRITNTARALNRMDSARFFEDRIRYLDSTMVNEVNATAALVPETVDEFLRLELKLNQWVRAGDRLIEAGDVLRGSAQMQIDVLNSYDRALELVTRAILFYERAEQYPHRYENVLFTHWAWAYTLLGRLQVRTWRAALGNFELALEKIDHHSVRSFNAYQQQIYRIDIRMLRARNIPESEDRELEIGQIIDALTQLVASSPAEATGWHRLYVCYHELRGDDSAALDILDQWLNRWRGRDAERGFQHVQYLAATTALDLAKGNEQFIGIALRRYIDLLCAQPRNTVVFGEFFDLFRRASRDEQSEIEVYALRQLPPLNSTACDVTHSALRLIFGDRTAVRSVDSVPRALVTIISADESELVASAVELIRVAMMRSKVLPIVIEFLTRELFGQARRLYLNEDRNAGSTLLARIDLLLDIALAAKRDDVIWWTRKADVSLLTRVHEPVALAESLIAVAPDDPIIRLKAAQLLIGSHNDRAEQILLDAENLSPEHPATLDRLALLATLRGDFERGAEIYDSLLERNNLDAGALWGRGRVEAERGNAEGAFRYWLSLLRVRSLASTPTDMVLAQRTAMAMADLCRAETTEDMSDAVRSRLILALWDESPVVSRRLLYALRIASIVDPAIVNAVIDVMGSTNDRLLRQQVAQYLMASAIDAVLTSGADRTELLENRFPRFVEWCSVRGVLGDLIFGAKGSYARTIARRTWQPSAESRAITTEIAHKLPTDDVEIIRAVQMQKRDSSYYRRGYEVATRFRSLSADRMAEYVLFAIYDVAHATSDAASVGFALDSMIPAVGLCAVDLRNERTTERKRVSAFVDSAAFNTLAVAFGVNGWRVDAEAIEATVYRFPTNHENRTYEGFGIRFQNNQGKDVCSINRAEVFVA